MAVTLSEAQAVVAANRGPRYTPEQGYVVADFGWENDEMFVIKSGAPVEVFGIRSDDDIQALMSVQLDAPVTAVMKETGEYREFYRLNGELPADDLVRFGDHP